MPRRTKDRLLVHGDEISPDQQGDQVSVAPQLAEAPLEPASVRRDDGFSFGVTRRRAPIGLRLAAFTDGDGGGRVDVGRGSAGHFNTPRMSDDAALSERRP